jgi:poly-gamma-glutamate system protein
MRRAIVAAGGVSLMAFLVVRVTAPERPLTMTPEMVVAAHLMNDAMVVIQAHRESMRAAAAGPAGWAIDDNLDPNRTGLIGPQYSPLFTTVGHLEAKRTTTVPDMAALLVHLLREAGVENGDRIAIGASGSFPALMIASVAAAESMMLEPAVVFSLGASSYGATDPDFNMLDLYRLLRQEVGVDVAAEAVSLGGGDDVGKGFEPEVRQRLIEQIEQSGIRFLYEPDLRSNVAARMAIFGDVTAFINVGGSDANLGTSPMVLDLEPGRIAAIDLPPEAQRGMVFEMAARGIPVIHLLNIRGLASRYGIPWDPVPLPGPGETRLYDARQSGGARLWLVAAGYFLSLFAVVSLIWKRPQGKSREA